LIVQVQGALECSASQPQKMVKKMIGCCCFNGMVRAAIKEDYLSDRRLESDVRTSDTSESSEGLKDFDPASRSDAQKRPIRYNVIILAP
jgi:hypothetical protein